MKRILVCVLILITSSILAQEEPPFYNVDSVFNEEGKLSYSIGIDELGVVIDSSTYTYNKSGKEIEKHVLSKGSGIYVYKFNNKDSLIELSVYNSKRKLDFKTNLIYDDKGNVIITLDYDSDKELVSLSRVQNDTNKREELRTLFNSKSEVFKKIIYKYDEEGNKVMESHIDADEKINHRYEWDFDKYGNITKGIFYDSRGDKSFWTNKYDKEGKLIESYDYDVSGKIKTHTTLKNNKRGNPIERKLYNSEDEILNSLFFKYDNIDRLIEMTNVNSNKEKIQYVFDYNNEGKLIKSVMYDSKGEVIRQHEFKR